MNDLSSEYWVHFQDLAGRQVYVLTGTCILDPTLTGPSDGSRWQRGNTSFRIPLRDLPDGQGLVVEHWAPSVVLGSIQNDDVANNAGWAVDDFNLTIESDPVNQIFPNFNYAVGDSDGFIMRVTYAVTLVGRLAPLSIIN